MTTDKILFVDDEPEVLKAFQRRFRSSFTVNVANGGAEALSAMATTGPYAVIVSDYRMPEMDGVEFLSRARDLAPDSIRIMLTGQPDMELAIKAVNEGRIFRFLTKPCPPEIVANAVAEALKYHRLVKTEREVAGLRKWRHSMEAMIRSFVSLMETRDPYTAGHQQRVTILATAIAEEMGLDAGNLEAVRLAATIHDIGKMYVPSEFLNRPGRLTEVEFNVIKVHPQVGCDILKPIDFEYPINLIVQQHHERIDGSGYPLALKGEDIMLEARIITVADVVEAMNSHRPYRPSLGIKAAMNEIEQHKGTHYDNNAVEACLSLLHRSGNAILA